MLSLISPSGTFSNIPVSFQFIFRQKFQQNKKHKNFQLLYLNGSQQVTNEKVYEANTYINDTLSNMEITNMTNYDSFSATRIQTSFSQI